MTPTHWIPTLAEMARPAAAWMLTYALHSTLLLAGAWLLGRALGQRRLAVQEAAWKAALLGGVVTASLQIALAAGAPAVGVDGFEPLAGRWSLAAVEAPVEAVEGTVVGALPTSAARIGEGRGEAGSPSPAEPAGAAVPSPEGERAATVPGVAAGGEALPAGAAVSASQATGRPGAASHSLASWWPLAAVGLWLGVAAFLLAALAFAYGRLAWRLRGRREVAEGVMPALFGRLRDRALGLGAEAAPDAEAPARAVAIRSLAAWLGRLGGHRGEPRFSGLRSGGMRRARLTASTWLPVPIAWGLARPEVSVPERAAHHLSPFHQESILAHELSHLLRRDPAWLGLARAVEAVLFFQPLNRVARRRLQEIAELRCDDRAVELTGRPLDLASCLTEVAAWRLAGSLPVPTLPAPGMAAGGSGLGRRVRRLVDRPPEAELRAPARRWLAATAAVVLVAMVLAAPGVTGQETADRDGEAEATAPRTPEPSPGETAPRVALPAVPPVVAASDAEDGKPEPSGESRRQAERERLRAAAEARVAARARELEESAERRLAEEERLRALEGARRTEEQARLEALEAARARGEEARERELRELEEVLAGQEEAIHRQNEALRALEIEQHAHGVPGGEERAALEARVREENRLVARENERIARESARVSARARQLEELQLPEIRARTEAELPRLRAELEARQRALRAELARLQEQLDALPRLETEGGEPAPEAP